MPGRGGSGLTARHGVDQVVYADDFQVDVAPRSVDQVVAANGREIAIARVNNDVEFWIREFQSGSKGNRATVGRVERIQLYVTGNATGAANAGYQGQRLQIDF